MVFDPFACPETDEICCYDDYPFIGLPLLGKKVRARPFYNSPLSDPDENTTHIRREGQILCVALHRYSGYSDDEVNAILQQQLYTGEGALTYVSGQPETRGLPSKLVNGEVVFWDFLLDIIIQNLVIVPTVLEKWDAYQFLVRNTIAQGLNPVFSFDGFNPLYDGYGHYGPPAYPPFDLTGVHLPTDTLFNAGDGSIVAWPVQDQFDGNSPPAGSAVGEIRICTTAGGGFLEGAIYGWDGTQWVNRYSDEYRITMTPLQNLTGGDVEFTAGLVYRRNIQEEWEVLGDVFTAQVSPLLADLEVNRVEFAVPKTNVQINGVAGLADGNPVLEAIFGADPIIPPDFAGFDTRGDGKVHLRGWYIKGKGVGWHRPLMFWMEGFTSSTLDSLTGVTGAIKSEFFKLMSDKGFDLLILDKPGHGWSDGINQITGDFFFWIMEQLEHGLVDIGGTDHEMRMIPEGGTSELVGAACVAENLLGKTRWGQQYTAKTKPVILMGVSQGSMMHAKTMALNVSSEDVSLYFTGPMDYNIQGAMETQGAYSTGAKWLAFDPFLSPGGYFLSKGYDFREVAFLDSRVRKTLPDWPGLISVKGTQDYFTPEGLVDAYNTKLTKFKRIFMVEGEHPSPWYGHNTAWTSLHLARWAKRMILRDSPDTSNWTTSLEREVWKLPGEKQLDKADERILRLFEKRNFLNTICDVDDLNNHKRYKHTNW